MDPQVPESSLAPPPAVLRDRRRRLLRWYDEHARDLPWRRGTDLYGTWVAEIMLQQTTVAAVIPRWRAFLDRFPDVRALAAADEAAVLAAWSGLGYYRRARALHRAAREVVERLGGRLPDSREGWRALPGIGDYAAGAIASIGLGLPVPAVDANVRRVLTRWTYDDPEQVAELVPARLSELAAAHVPAARPGDWNQALMDLGAGRCRAGEPDCRGCPVLAHCAAGRAGTGGSVPPVVARSPVRPVVLGALVLRAGDAVLLLASEHATVARARGLGRARREGLTGLFRGMLNPPLTPWYDDRDGGTESADRAFERAWRGWLRGLGAVGLEPQPAGELKHAITVYRLRVLVSIADWPLATGSLDLPGAAWSTPQVGGEPISTLARKIMRRNPLG